VIFANDANHKVRAWALEMLARAERLTGLPTNAATGFHAAKRMTVVVFRDPALTTRAEVLEELRHLEWARLGHWNKAVPGMFTAFQVRELDAAAYFRVLWQDGKVTKEELDDTLRNLAHHLSEPGRPVTSAEALRIVEGLLP
jgi:hypothetical protein